MKRLQDLIDTIDEFPVEFSSIDSFNEYFNCKMNVKPWNEAIYYTKIKEKGEDIVKFKCMKCGEEFSLRLEDAKDPKYYGDRRLKKVKCPNCCNEKIPEQASAIYMLSEISNNIQKIVFKIIDGDIYILKYTFTIECSKDYVSSNEAFEKLGKEMFYKISLEKNRIFVYSKKFGIRCINGLGYNKNFYAIRNENFKYMVSNLKYDLRTKIEDIALKEEVKNIIGVNSDEELIEKLTTIQSSVSRNENSKDSFLEKELMSYKIENLELIKKQIQDQINETPYYPYEKNGDNETNVFVCPSCGEVVFLHKKASRFSRYDNGFKAKCEHCGKELVVRNNSFNIDNERKTNKSEYILFSKYKEYFVISVFSLDRDIIYKDNKFFSTNKILERYRIYYSNKRQYIYLINENCGEMQKLNSSSFYSEISGSEYEIFNAKSLQSIDEIQNIAKETSIGKTGFIEYLEFLKSKENIDLGKNLYKLFATSENYMSNYYRFNSIEKFIKAGLYRVTYQITRFSTKDIKETFNKKEPSLTKLLKVSKPVLRMAVKGDLSLYSITSLQKIWELDNSITLEQFQDIFDKYSSIEKYLDILRHNIKIKRAEEYIQSCYDYQCIEKDETIMIWTDYLNMADKLKLNLSDKSVKFPSSLKKEHDKAIFAYRAIKEEVDLENFKKYIAKNKNIEYEKDNLIVILPETPEDIVAEGNMQHHCVASYVSKVKEGRTLIAFIRNKEEKEKSFYTVEVLNGKIVQLRGKCNCNPTEEVKKFVKEWAKEKKLIMQV